ncbi:hypothetical protein HELRODRAFT_101525 [Helobdella robusta]|uniref:Amino acid transporter transmembrane domain-containing protein n=1 Tax=Helobdella robusta TaxID=6412 RepID=T1ED52_HELRO|nr:hypothetical protein HELRODRAFT_101525 [Helobdella robusta]ESN99538.1 hypothetical protein HELRODRAFT_101525 [Helobdella robusta]
MDAQRSIVRKKHVEYSPMIGMVFLFNLIVGTGALALPKSFSMAGWGVSLVMIIVVAFLSYVTATYVIETMACANALLKVEILKKNEDHRSGAQYSSDIEPGEQIQQTDTVDESTALLRVSDESRLDLFEIQEVIEMGSMAKIFFNKVGYNLFYLCIAVYLFGDLAIYAAAVPKTLRDVTCTFYPNVTDGNHSLTNITNLCPTLKNDDPCWIDTTLTRIDIYRIYVACFIFLLGSFVFFNLQKTKYLQVATSVMRWIAFFTMVILTIQKLAKGKGKGHPTVASPMYIPNLFGICVYSFMCHHSLPQMITPINNKSSLFKLFAGNYFSVFLFYCLLAFTGIFCFSNVYDLYTLNFQPPKCPNAAQTDDTITTFPVIQYFLALFPVFTISTSFPIIGITLRNNLKHMFGFIEKDARARMPTWQKFIDRLVFPTVVLLIPFAIAMVTSDIQFLVGITGSYAGNFIQYIVPASLVLMARRRMTSIRIDDIAKFKSPFKHFAWVCLVFSWSIICFIVVTINNILLLKSSGKPKTNFLQIF